MPRVGNLLSKPPTAPLEVGLPRTARRFLGLLRRQIWLKSERWSYLSLQQVATTLGVSVRSINRAKLELEERKLALFRTLTNGRGRGHRVVTADPAELDLETPGDEVYTKTKAGKPRHFWTLSRRYRLAVAVSSAASTRCRGPSDILPTPIIGAAKAARKADPEPDLEHRLASSRPLAPPPILQDLSLPPKRPVFRPHPYQNRPLTKRQKRLAHALKREFLGFFYDNIKVQQPTEQELGSLYNLACRWLSRGLNQTWILQAFETALLDRHRLATDLQLLRGCRYPIPFTVASTITGTDSNLWKRLNSSLVGSLNCPRFACSRLDT